MHNNNRKEHIMRFTVSMIMLLAIMSANAQQHPITPTNDKLHFVVGNESAINDTIANPYKILVDNIPSDPEFTAPHFAIIDKDQKFYLSIGARVKAVALYDWENPYNNPSDFKPSDFTPAMPGNDQLLQMSIKSSSVNFNIIGMPKNKYRIGIFIALTFNGGQGNKYIIKCDHAYIRCLGLTFGYTSSLYDDKTADAFLIDGNGAGASGGHSNMSINVQRHITSNLKFGVGLELPKTSYTTLATEQETFQRVPAVPAYIQYAWGNIGHIRLSGILRSLRYHDIVSNRYRNQLGYGLKITANATTGNLVGYFMAQAGKGIANYLKNNDGFNLDLVPSETTPGRLNRTDSWGFLSALQYNYTPKTFSTVMYGYLRNYVDYYSHGIINHSEHMKYEHYGAINFIWRASSFVDLGVEYNYGMKRDFGNTRISNNRISAMFRVGF